uniref:Uncharacterized protein n=1 Tax=Cacopsylla melanoneura TaxID=428564 RepID=A0A8D8X4C4_9HEMI
MVFQIPVHTFPIRGPQTNNAINHNIPVGERQNKHGIMQQKSRFSAKELNGKYRPKTRQTATVKDTDEDQHQTPLPDEDQHQTPLRILGCDKRYRQTAQITR